MCDSLNKYSIYYYNKKHHKEKSTLEKINKKQNCPFLLILISYEQNFFQRFYNYLLISRNLYLRIGITFAY